MPTLDGALWYVSCPKNQFSEHTHLHLIFMTHSVHARIQKVVCFVRGGPNLTIFFPFFLESRGSKQIPQ